MKKQRFWEIDLLRGIAIIKMVIFNWSFALFYLGIYFFEEGMAFPGLAAAVFIFLVGLSLTISYSRVKKWERRKLYKKYFSRGLKIFGYGILITVITFLTFPEVFVIFGILHFIGISIILGQFFLKFEKLNLFLGILIIVLGFYLKNFIFDFPWLLWLGFTPTYFYTFDYFPIFPWFGITLLGIYFGNLLYKNGKRRFKIKNISNLSLVKFLTYLGRKSLIIYLVHQPVLVLFLLILGFKIF
ncbi:MAG: DUF1624 domain-containing protein [Candidatus Aenigmarchaeota archaeon]|nr:DUF1624 domain-containing protein [Candidatus Aenigmarchaeota archaeon]